jgi:PAS domain S-box-containing protein
MTDVDLVSRRLAAIVGSSDDAIIGKDLEGTITSWNRGAERIFGYTAHEAMGQSIRMIIPADRQAEEDVVLSRIRNGERMRHFETMRRRKDHSLVPVSLTISPIRDDTDVVIGASTIARDMSERQQLVTDLQQQVEVTEKLNAIASTVASELDRDTIVQKVTDSATELTGAEFGAFFYNVTDPNSGAQYLLYTLSGAPREAFAKFPNPRATGLFGPTFRGEGIVRVDDVKADPRYGHNPPYHGMPEGHLPVRSYLAVPVKSRDGVVLGGLFFGHSRAGVFTARHEQLADGLAAWASLALENARLYTEAQHAARLKDEFLAVLSHELRTPLNAILGYSRLLRSGIITGEKGMQGLATLERNATALAQIVEDVLDVSRIIAGKVRLNVQAMDVPLVLHHAVATILPAADAKGVRVQTIADPRVGPVAGDPDRLQQVLWNLLSNAVKFTPRGGRIQVRLEQVNSHIEIIVSDSGIGIRPDFLPHVFERFRQGEGGTTRSRGGLGLGLAIVRHLVEMHGGSVEASSAGEGQGAMFCVRLPRMIVQPMHLEERREHPRAERVGAAAALTDLTGIHVVVVDDEEDARTLLRVVLETAGARVTPIESARGALDAIQRLQPDVLLADLGMPHMDGFELIAQVRESPIPEVRTVPAAALTAYARSDDRTRALQSGYEMHLAKPVDPGELAAAVAALARRSRMSPPDGNTSEGSADEEHSERP